MRTDLVAVELSPAERSAYKSMEKDFIVAVEGGVITAANALVRILRLDRKSVV
mgnify:CR=1 FL=1